MASTYFPRSSIRGFFSLVVAIIPALVTMCGAGASEISPPRESEVVPPDQTLAEEGKDQDLLSQDETYFAPVLSDIGHVLTDIADVASMTHSILEGGAPHLVLFVEGLGPGEGRDHIVVQTMRTLAENHQLGFECQFTTLDDGLPLFGFLLFQRFPTLELAWETNPFEAISSLNGAWRQPFADLSDVESVHVSDGRATLVMSEAAARRIDLLSEVQGHRNYRVRGTEMADAELLGGYTWIPGLRRVPRVPSTFKCRLPRRSGAWKEGVTLDYLRQRFTVHAAARERIRRELQLADDINWTISPTPPRYAEPFFAWMVHLPEAGGRATQLPWYRATPESVRRWLHVLEPADPASNAVIPRHWQLTRSAEGLELVPRPAPNQGAITQEDEFVAFMRQNMGGEMALVMQGQVAGVIAITAAHPEVLALSNMSTEASTAVERLWNVANSGVATAVVAAAALPAPEPSVIEPDVFQVRLMAEPQDREVVSVTHFESPGSAPGTVVAVLDDIILDGKAVTGAYLEQKGDKLFLRLTFTPEAREHLGGACFGNMGKQLAILYKNKLLCAPTIDDWEIEELSFKGMDSDWPEVARDLANHFSLKG